MTDLMHQVVTKNYPENQVGGIMLCGINFGYSAEDENHENAGTQSEPEPLSFFSDKAVNNTRFRNRILAWLSSWGLEFATIAGDEGAFERSFFQTNWLDTQTRSITSNGNITNETLVKEADSFLGMLETRKPSVIIFFGVQMINALNDERVRPRVISILGERSGNPQTYEGDLPNYQGTKFKLLAQKFGETQIISFPHPQAQGITDEYVASLKPPAHVIQSILEKMGTPISD